MQDNQVALVTGANQGIGFQIAKDLAAHGFTVLVGSRDIHKGQAAAREVGPDAHALQLDVTDAASIAAAAERIRSEFGRLDVLVNNAAISNLNRSADTTLEEYAELTRASVVSLDEVRAIWETNVFGPLAVYQAVLPLLRQAPAGRIVNVSSGVGSLTRTLEPGYPYRAIFGPGYAVSKTALNGITVAMALELESTPIKVNAVSPGFTKTNLNNYAGTETLEEGAAQAVRMAYVTLGRSGLRVSPFCLGAMTFGQDLGADLGASVDDSEAILAHYLDLGGNFIDTANIYTSGHSEKIIGDFFRKGKGERDRVVIATKFFMNLFAGDPNGGGAGRKAILAQCEESLRRLQTDYIDLYYLHLWDRFTPIEETLSALDDLVKAGKVRYIGFSDAPAWKVAQAQIMAHFRGWSPLIALQIEYSLMQRTVEGELVPMAQELGLGVLPWSPLKGGALSGKYTRANGTKMQGMRGARMGEFSEKQFDIIDAVAKVAAECASDPASVALAWLRAKAGVSSVLVGARTLEQFTANLKALDLKLTTEQMDTLDEVSHPTLNFPAEFLAPAPNFSHAGATVNGILSQPSFLVPKEGAPRW